MKTALYGDNWDFEINDDFKIQVKRTDVGYVIDFYTVEGEFFIGSYTLWDDDIKQVLDEELGDVTCDDPLVEEDL